MNSRLMAFALGTILVSACSNGGGTAPNESNGKQSTEQQAVQGAWQDSCHTWSDSVSMSTHNVATVAGSNITIVGSVFASKDCSGAASFAITSRMTFDIPSKSETDPTILNVDTVLQSLTETVLDQPTAILFNKIEHCGFTDWTVGQEKDVTGLDCGAKKGETVYSVVKITGDQLQLGESDAVNDGTTPERRHKNLGQQVFTRK